MYTPLKILGSIAVALTLLACADRGPIGPATGDPSFAAGGGQSLRDLDASATLGADTTVLVGDVLHLGLVAGDGNGPQDNKNVVWATSDAAVVSVAPDRGTATLAALSPGTAVVSATLGGKTVSVAITVAGVNTPPTAAPDAYDAIGNVTLTIPAPGVLANDTDEEGGLTVVPGTFSTTGGGMVTLSPDGGFVYRGAAGYTGVDAFDYDATDGAASSTATVTLTLSYRVWYVKNDATAPGDGRDASPFVTLAQAETASSAGERIFVFHGDGTTTGLDQGITLKAGQALIGQGVSSSVTTPLNGQTVVLLAAGSAPTITRSSAGATVQLAAGDTVRGVAIESTAGAGISGSGFGSFVASESSVDAVGGAALQLANGAVDASFTALGSAGSATDGLTLQTLTGTLTAASATSAASGILQGSVARAVRIEGGSADIEYKGRIVNSTGGILVQNNVGGTILLDGDSKVLHTGSSVAVTLANNPGATVQIAGGGLDITTSGAIGYSASGGGTAIVTGADNEIASVGAAALDVRNVTIGAGGLAFRSISANGGASGIVLQNTGALSGLLVSGDGSTAASGGTIQGTTGAAISLDDASHVQLVLMTLKPQASGWVATNLGGSSRLERSTVDYQGAAPAGSFAFRVANASTNASVTLNGTTFQNKLDPTPAVSISATGSSQITFNAMDGTTSDAFDNEFTNLFGSAIAVSSGDAPGSTALVNVNVSDAKFLNAPANGLNNLELAVTQNATLVPHILDSTFDKVAMASAVAGVINVSAFDMGRLGSSSTPAIIQGNTITNIRSSSPTFAFDPAGTQGYIGMRFAIDNVAGGVNHKLQILGNTVTNVARQAVLISSRGAADDVNVRVQGNTFGTASAPVGTPSNRRAVEVDAQTASAMKVEVVNNPSIVGGTTGTNSALHLRAGVNTGATSAILATVVNNVIANPNTSTADGRFRAETVSGGLGTMCLDLRNNTLESAAKLFQANNNGGTYNLNASGNTGTVTTVGVVDPTASCPLPSF
jgi:hypothetical protein